MAKYRMMPDKGTAINAVALAAVVILFALVIFQGVTLVKMKQYNDDSQRFTEYWRHKTDSLLDENFKLYMQIYELKDSDDIQSVQIIATCKDGQHIMAASDDKILIRCVAEWCQFVRLKEELFEQCSIRELIADDNARRPEM